MKNKNKYAVGVMSGTSLDGIDVALVKIDGVDEDTKVELVDFCTFEYDNYVRNKIKLASQIKTSNVLMISELNMEIGELFSDCVKKVLERNILNGDLLFIASHGQTIHHLPKGTSNIPGSFQIGDPSFMAYDHKVPVIFNFRVMDIVAGGEGAPLVPYSEYVIYRSEVSNVLLQNIGGIGNVTVLKKSANIEDVWAFDTGPGNMMINAAVEYYYNEPYDKNGMYASRGNIIEELIDELKCHSYLQTPPPKSTGREMFGEIYTRKLCQKYQSNPNDVIATLTFFAAYSIIKAYQDFIIEKGEIYDVIVGGGGAHNPVLMQHLKDLGGKDLIIYTQDEKGFSSDAKEAVAFAILGNQTYHGRPSNVPRATGSTKQVILGSICPNPHLNKKPD